MSCGLSHRTAASASKHRVNSVNEKKLRRRPDSGLNLIPNQPRSLVLTRARNELWLTGRACALFSGTDALTSQLLRLAARDTFPSRQGPDSYIFMGEVVDILPSTTGFWKELIWLDSNWRRRGSKSVAWSMGLLQDGQDRGYCKWSLRWTFALR